MSITRIRLRSAVVVAAAALAFGCADAEQAKEDKFRRTSSHYDLGVGHLKEGNSAMAIRELQAALSYDEKLARVHHALAEAFRVSGRFTDAEAHLQRAIALEPSFQGARLSLSALYVQMERYQDAIRESQALVTEATFPAPWRAYTNIGWAQLKLGHVPEARKSFEQALAMKGNYWPALLNLGILESQDGHRAEAIEYFTRVLKANPGLSAEVETNYRMAEVYVSLGERERALQHLTVVIERQPSGEWGKRSQEYRKLLQ